MEKNTILVVDDMPGNLGVLFEALYAAGYNVLIQDNGESALELLNTFQPDLILLDILMPGMDGFEVLRRLKNNPLTQDIPVIIITALLAHDDEVKGLKLGAADYITKPFHVETVLARVQIHIANRNLQKMLIEQNEKLKQALDNIKTLSGLIPICARCKKIRDDQGYWNQIESFIQQHTDAIFSHGLCPECAEHLYGKEDWYQEMKKEGD